MAVPWPAAAAVARGAKVLRALPPTAMVPPTPEMAGLPVQIPPPVAATTTNRGIRGELAAAAAAVAREGAVGFCFLGCALVPRGLRAVVVVVVAAAAVMTREEPSRGGTRSVRCSMRTRRSEGLFRDVM